MKKVLEILKSLFKPKKRQSKETILRIQEERKKTLDNIMHQINEGDIVWAKRYSNKKEKNEIPYDHREGPFIVLGKCDKGLVCSKGTGVQKDNRGYLTFNSSKYNLYKETYFKFFELDIIDDYRYINKKGEITKDDLRLCYNKIKELIRSYDYDKDNIKLSFKPDVGDVVYYGETYLIVDKSETALYGLPMQDWLITNSTELDYISKLDYSSLTKIDNTTDLIFIYSLCNENLLKVLNKQKEYYKKVNSSMDYNKGEIVIKNDNYYYVDGMEGWDLLVFKLLSKNFPKSDVVIINKKNYYTDYEQLKINKKDDLQVYEVALESEIEEIKAKKKSYRKTHKNDNKIMYRRNYNIGDVIELKNCSDIFLIAHVYANTYGCLIIRELKGGIYNPVYIRKAEARDADKSILNEIRWFEINPDCNPKNIAKKGSIQKILTLQREYNSSLKK